MKGVVVAGTASGVGKTVTTLAVCRALEREGYTVQPAKAGPDFIDPSHHAAIVGEPSRTLDPWLEGEDGMRRTYARGEGDICVVEGMMGLYDGDTSTARVAALLDLPVVLVADARAGMQSVAATAYGFRTYADRMGIDADVAGVIASRAHGGRHAEGIRDALPEELPYLGRIPPSDDLEIPERHLGLHLGDEAPLSDAALDAAADGIRADALADVAREPEWDAEEVEASSRAESSQATNSDGPTVAVARDERVGFLDCDTVRVVDGGLDGLHADDLVQPHVAAVPEEALCPGVDGVESSVERLGFPVEVEADAVCEPNRVLRGDLQHPRLEGLGFVVELCDCTSLRSAFLAVRFRGDAEPLESRDEVRLQVVADGVRTHLDAVAGGAAVAREVRREERTQHGVRRREDAVGDTFRLSTTPSIEDVRE